MSNITLEKIAELLKQELEPIKATQSEHTRLLNLHASALDAIAKNTSDWQGEMTVMRNRMGRYETALTALAKKAGIDIKHLLH